MPDTVTHERSSEIMSNIRSKGMRPGDGGAPDYSCHGTRDAEHQTKLAEAGWDVLVIWECDVKADAGIADRIQEFFTPR